MTGPRRPGLALAASLALAAGCGDDRFVGGLHAIAMTPDTPYAIETASGLEVWHLITRDVRLPIRAPSSDELAGLDGEPPGYPFPRRPWVGERDVAVEIDWVLRHAVDPAASSAPVTAAVVIDGVSEFVRYLPGFDVDGDAVAPFRSGWEREVTLAPGEQVGDTVTEAETWEVARDLAALAGGAPDPDAVVAPGSDSRRDPEAAARVPSPTPGLVGVRLGIRAEVAAPLVLEATVRARDRGDRLAGRGEAAWDVRPRPRALSARDAIEAAFGGGGAP